MTRAEIADKVKQALASVAPELESASIGPDEALRDQADLDSMDFLRFVIELRRQFGIEVPEVDYQQLGTLNGVVAYLAAHLDGPAVAPERVSPGSRG